MNKAKQAVLVVLLKARVKYSSSKCQYKVLDLNLQSYIQYNKAVFSTLLAVNNELTHQAAL